jgi:hypothetical protein
MANHQGVTRVVGGGVTVSQTRAGQNAKQKQRTVSLWRDGQMLCVEPAPGALLDHLQTVRLVAGPDQQHGYRVARERQPLYDVWPGSQPNSNMLKIWAGLEPAVRNILTGASFSLPPGTIPTAKPIVASTGAIAERLKKAGGADQPFLDLVRFRERGLVVIDPDVVSPARLVAQVALAAPDHSVTVAVSRKEDGYALRNALRKYVPEVQFFHGKHQSYVPTRLAIATFRYLDHRPVSLDDRDIVIAHNAREVVCQLGLDQLANARRARLFGIRPQKEEISPHERDLMRMVFGFEEVYLPGHGERERLVRVARCVASGGPELAPEADPFALQRDGVWNNHQRNGVIATLAGLLKARAAAALSALVPDATVAVGALAAPRVVVLVEQLLHGLALAELLPGWPLLADLCGPSPRNLTEAQLQVVAAGKQAWEARPAHAIVTRTGMLGVDLRDVDIVVRADAGAGLPAIPDAKLIEPADGPVRPLLLLDLDDRHPQLQKSSQRRQRAYEERGWFAPGVDPDQGRVELFLRGRGRRA